MNRHPKPRLKWLGGILLALGLTGCITYTGEYANDGYYRSAERSSTYNDSYYGDYYYSAVPSISITYNLLFGFPFYGYYGCSYWTPYCGGLYPGYFYGYGYGQGYGFGWGHRPYYYGHQKPRHRHKPKPPRDQPSAPDAGSGQTMGQKPIRSYPRLVARGQPILKAQTPTPPVSTGATNPVITWPNATDTPQKISYWRIPQNQQRQQAELTVRRLAQPQKEDLQSDSGRAQDAAEYVLVERTPRASVGPIRISNPKPVNIPEATVLQDARPNAVPERLERPVLREPKQKRTAKPRRADIDTGEQP